MSRPLRTLWPCAALTVAACVGPDFHTPPAPRAERYTAVPLAASGGAQQFLAGQQVPRNWWTLFRSASLDALVEEALRHNPNVAAAQAALRQAHENTAAQRGAYFPGVQTGFEARRESDAVGVISPTLSAGTALFDLYTPQVQVSYLPDVFGANRRAVESLAAQEEAARDQLDATYLTLVANVVTATVQAASLRDQLAATRANVALAREALTVMQQQLQMGSIAPADLYAQQATVAQLEAAVPPLDRQWRQTLDLLAVLTGKLPADFDAALPENLEALQLPAEVPLGVPSELVRRRPDVRAAEAQLHAATAQVGVAVANLLPQLTLTANLGSSATAMQDLFHAGTRFWSVGGSLSQTLFAGGTLIHRKRAADAALDQAGALYQAAVLTAFQNVADALHALDTDAAAVSAADASAAAARRSLEVAHRQLDLGSVNQLSLIIAEQADQQANIQRIQACAGRLADTAALFQALGGSIAPVNAAGGDEQHPH